MCDSCRNGTVIGAVDKEICSLEMLEYECESYVAEFMSENRVRSMRNPLRWNDSLLMEAGNESYYVFSLEEVSTIES